MRSSGARQGTVPLVLVLTASMGDGHVRVAEELARRLRGRKLQVEIVDLLQILPRPMGRCLRSFYAAMLRWTPWVYEAIYRAWFEPRRTNAAPVSPVTWLGGRAVRRWVLGREPVAVISSFHLCSRILGDLRRADSLSAPTATVIVDFAVHDLWVDPDVDLHVCLHPRMALEAQQRGARRATAPGPVVRPCFVDSVWDRQSARASLGIAEEERTVLIVAGSWGAGDIATAVDLISEVSGLTALVVCGRDERLRRHLADRPSCKHGSRIMGWVPDMDRLMLAADVVVENAGGLTCMEALVARRAVVSFNPIPGHGRANVRAMAESGIVEYVRQARDLAEVVSALSVPGPGRSRLLAAAAEMFQGDAADDILTLLGSHSSICRARSV